jgi:hypothetical protein
LSRELLKKNLMHIPFTSVGVIFNTLYLKNYLTENKKIGKDVLNDAEIKEKYLVKITNRFAALENFNDNVDMNRAWENIIENINISAKESLGHYKLQQRKPWFDAECSKLIDRRKQWLQNMSQVNGVNMDNVRCEGSRTFRMKKGNI